MIFRWYGCNTEGNSRWYGRNIGEKISGGTAATQGGNFRWHGRKNFRWYDCNARGNLDYHLGNATTIRGIELYNY
jgi:hypothetical protein